MLEGMRRPREHATVYHRLLHRVARAVNRSRGTGHGREQPLDGLLECLFRPSRRLAVYGSLAPGREHHERLSPLPGTWRRGTVTGRLRSVGWGRAYGYPALSLDPRGEAIEVWLLDSPELPQHWCGLDRFEGGEYLRGVAPVRLAYGLLVVAQIYLAGPGSCSGPPPGASSPELGKGTERP